MIPGLGRDAGISAVRSVNRGTDLMSDASAENRGNEN